ncbi:aminoglycoside phosphotransferase [Neobacillus massiliamazoniensis]|uniref:Aminoglycoside phosphotransferase n=2 Tax=Neobacillus massiliamazoniensis TaxID=1499688 RepID=A0A0U1P1X5_9BACI|nr:aminoglycoside phosphotransferase [Neobacillus massiliamazoniensis]
MGCLDISMKAMTNNIYGDDPYLNRLLSYFQSQFYEKIIRMVPIRNHVFLVKTEKHTYILKGYQSYSRLRLQEAFTETLRKEGFSKTYMFVSPEVKEPLFFEGTYFGCTKYIVPHKKEFTFHTEQNRQEGLGLLEQFHQVTASFETRYRTLLAKSDLIEKWSKRMHAFSSKSPLLSCFINKPYFSEIMSWANWSLDGMKKNRQFFQNEPYVILHGDVAHHNFLRDSAGNLNLIDFDLITIGNRALDILQYANRILPFLNWSYDQLTGYKQIQQFFQEDGFLYALVYPADIFREWNRLIREKLYPDKDKLKQVMDLTIGQFYERKNFIDQIIRAFL